MDRRVRAVELVDDLLEQVVLGLSGRPSRKRDVRRLSLLGPACAVAAATTTVTRASPRSTALELRFPCAFRHPQSLFESVSNLPTAWGRATPRSPASATSSPAEYLVVVASRRRCRCSLPLPSPRPPFPSHDFSAQWRRREISLRSPWIDSERSRAPLTSRQEPSAETGEREVVGRVRLRCRPRAGERSVGVLEHRAPFEVLVRHRLVRLVVGDRRAGERTRRLIRRRRRRQRRGGPSTVTVCTCVVPGPVWVTTTVRGWSSPALLNARPAAVPAPASATRAAMRATGRRLLCWTRVGASR